MSRLELGSWLAPALAYAVVTGLLGVTTKIALRTITWPTLILWAAAVYAVVAVVLLTVWALTGADGFWPAWPLGFWGAALLFKGPVPWAHAGRRVTPGRG